MASYFQGIDKGKGAWAQSIHRRKEKVAKATRGCRKEEKKTAAALEKAAQEKQKHDAENGEAANGQEKKRRIASKLMSELTDSDPPVLLARFPSCQIPVLEDLDPWMAY